MWPPERNETKNREWTARETERKIWIRTFDMMFCQSEGANATIDNRSCWLAVSQLTHSHSLTTYSQPLIISYLKLVCVCVCMCLSSALWQWVNAFGYLFSILLLHYNRLLRIEFIRNYLLTLSDHNAATQVVLLFNSFFRVPFMNFQFLTTDNGNCARVKNKQYLIQWNVRRTRICNYRGSWILVSQPQTNHTIRCCFCRCSRCSSWQNSRGFVCVVV